MQRILILGCPGSGKSTLARALRDKLSLPLTHLDQLWHRPDGTNVSPEAFDSALADVLGQDRWIIDGTYLRTLPQRLARCDTVILLDYPLEVCLQGITERIGRKRDDMPWVEETLDPAFQQYVLDFPQAQLGPLRQLVAAYAEGREVRILKSREEAQAWLAGLEV